MQDVIDARPQRAARPVVERRCRHPQRKQRPPGVDEASRPQSAQRNRQRQRVEVTQQVKAWGVGSGLNDLDLAVRLRYEIAREFAPYIGAEWLERFGETADMAAQDREFLVLAGLRVWL